MFLRLLDRFEETFVSFLMVAAVLIIFVAVCQRYSVGLVADVVAWARVNDYPSLMANARSLYRSLTNINLLWAQELCIYLFVWMAKFGAAYGVRLGIHVGVDVLVTKVSEPMRKTLTVIALLSGALFTFIVAWIGASFTWDIGHTNQVSADLEVPMWIVYLAVPLGSSLMCFRFLQALYNYLRTGQLPHHVPGHDDEQDSPEGAAA
ncbi:TRAP transporter small permease [Kerstersia gyiorum]|jgi:C4-dicarboxylate transporter DctQ subunit|uniref:TRAP transporter small permease protein n=1 Tax=Kerstersia gyiorum TaxID=206506 RepID=A0A171KQZ0_9BURK|nr:TRAP transporter small permease [Kerstersia gyiorum]AZV93702.1 TRAP transporter small permease [Bordetella sp. J329]MCO7640144.1 TRAP transporter small permease [Pseudomonas sp. S 311-6]KAB0543231.1 TRAP transporter small permease [Kerstersia gyiorum]KKO71307.1 C4-dicarboxylate ABC transporter substrate-binding protein [Kerstersia gyiorum]MCH4273033.1 TRAP transporter small permease [Kerstersia gyiorum]